MTSETDRSRMSRLAWQARGMARVHGPTPVGCCVRSDSGHFSIGCNVEHRYRSHDIHAEVNAIASAVAAGARAVTDVFIAAERERFSPCGACMDWIFELGGSACRVHWQSHPSGEIYTLFASELMPFYPI